MKRWTICAMILLGCETKPPAPPVPVPATISATIAETASPAPPPVAEPPVDTGPGEPEPLLPADVGEFDAACRKDSDCGTTSRFVSGQHACCNSCDTRGASMTWVTKFNDHCEAQDLEACPRPRCRAPGGFPRCVDGVCEVEPPEPLKIGEF